MLLVGLGVLIYQKRDWSFALYHLLGQNLGCETGLCV
jgi:hypothetical protein